jgi:outer membrane protein assembly factor BamB
MPNGSKRPSLGRGRVLAIAATVVVVFTVLAAFVFLLPGSSSPSSTENLDFIDSRYPNVDISNTRYAEGPIRSVTVSDLDVAWTLPIDAKTSFGGDVASPVVAGGIAYSQDLASDVLAIELGSGDILWKKKYGSSTSGPNGVVVADGHVYGATTSAAFALDQETGREIWSTSLIRNGSEKISMAPGHHNGLIYASTAPGALEGGEVGVLWALDDQTGRKVWSFDTVPRGLWGNPRVNSGGGLAYTPAFDAKGSMYFGVNNPGPIPGTEKYPWGSSRPGPNIYTNSIVKLNAKTGTLEWYYQLRPHDLCNGDLGPPVLAKVGGRDLVIAAGKSGEVVALDRETGKPVWKRAVGIHNGHDNDGLYAMRGEYSKLKLPMTVYPGSYGGVFAPLSVSRSEVFVPVVNYGAVLLSQTQQSAAGGISGELVTLDLATGRIEWKHRFKWGLFGPPTAVNDLVFATTAEGTMYAFDGDSGRELWRTSLPAGINAGLTISGDTLLAPAGLAEGEGQTPEILAYRLSS